MKPPVATALGLVAATVLPAAFMGLRFPLFGRHTLDLVLTTAAFLLLCFALAALVLGTPAYLLLRRFGLVRWWSSIACGALVGWLGVLILSPYAYGNLEVQQTYAALGAVSGLIFWLVWRLGRQP